MAKAKPGYIFIECSDCGIVEVKYYKTRKWKMKCPKCNKILSER